MFITRFNKLLYFIVKLILWTGGLAACAISLLYLRLSYGPIDLSALKDHVQQNLNQDNDFLSLEMHKPELVWQGLGHPLEIRATDVQLLHTKGQAVAVQIPEIAATFRLRSLLKAKIIPSTLTVIQPAITITKSATSFSESPDDMLEKFILRLFNPNNRSKALKKISLSKAKITIDDPSGLGYWILPETNLELLRRSAGIETKLDIHLSDQALVHLSGIYLAQEKLWQTDIELAHINPKLLVQNIPFLATSSSLQPFAEQLKSFDLPLSAKMHMVFNSNWILQTLQLQGTGGKGTVVIPDLLPTPVSLQKVSIGIHYHDQQLETCLAQLDMADGRLSIKVQGSYDPPSSTLKFDAQTRLTNFDMRKLKTYWPSHLASLPREWVVNNISEGHIPAAIANIEGGFNHHDYRMEIAKLEGQIQLDKATVAYLSGMPKVTHIDALARYDMEKMDIAIKSGKTLDTLRIKKGQVSISGLHAPEQSIKLDLTIEGPVQKAIELINCKPLELIKNIDFSFKGLDGQAQSQVILAFPLRTSLNFGQIALQVKSHLKDIKLDNPLKLFPIHLTQGQAILEADNNHIKIDGEAHLNGDPAQIRWENAFAQNAPYAMRLALKVALSPQGLKKFQPILAEAITGVTDINLKYDTRSNGDGTLDFQADMKRAELKLGTWKKPSFQPGKITALIDLKKGKLHQLRSFQARSDPGLHIEALGTFNEKGDFFKDLTVKPFVMGQTHLQATVRPHRHSNYRIHISGETLDLEPWIDHLLKDKHTRSYSDLRFDLNAEIQKVYLEEEKVFYRNAINLAFHNNQVSSLSYVGYFEPQGHQNIFINLFPYPHGRRIIMKCAQVGELFKALGIFKNFHGGRMKLAAIQNDDGGRTTPWQGKLLIEDFKLTQVPFLGRLLSLAFPTGFTDFFSNNKSMTFSRLKTKFRINADKLLITSGRAYGPSLGFTINGSIQNGLNNLNIHGSIIPAYFLNTLIAKIPLVGQILTGGKHEGIFGVSYTVQGTRSDPAIQVNPVSAFTPGLLRRMFAPTDADDINFDETDDIDDDEDFKEDELG